MANAAEHQRWNDERWTRSWPQREQLTDAVTPFLMAALAARPGERVLDVGCGGGRTTLALAQAVAPDGTAVGVDVSEPLTSLARERARDWPTAPASFVVADAQTERLPGAPFDAVTSQFGVMFFDDPLAAFANLRRHLRRAGRLVFACWGPAEQNEWHTGRTLAPFVMTRRSTTPGAVPPGPFSLGDADATTALLRGAGFERASYAAHSETVRAPANAVFEPSQLAFYGVPDDRRAGAVAAVTGHLAQFDDGAGAYAFPLSFLIVSAVAP